MHSSDGLRGRVRFPTIGLRTPNRSGRASRLWSLATPWLLLLTPALLVPLSAVAESAVRPAFSVQGLADLRLIQTGETRSWLERGGGKFRFGGNGDEVRTLGQLTELGLLAIARLSSDLGAVVQLQHRADQSNALDLVQGFAQYRRVFGESAGPDLRVRGGFFFPPISLEHDQPGWHSEYSITPSAINSWIGEEVRTLGVESTLSIPVGDRTRVAATLATFGGNDPAGSLVSYRGWALHDIKSGLSEDLPIPPLPRREPGGIFYPNQAPLVSPFREIDNRLGVYGGLSLRRAANELRLLRYDNRADETRVEDRQWAWDTRFTAAGVRYFLPARLELNAQWLQGITQMGRNPAGEAPIDDRFTAWYVLITRSAGRGRLTARFDNFEVDDRNGPSNGNDAETGFATTLAYSFEIRDRQVLTAEWLHSESDRPSRPEFGEPESVTENLFQLNYRLRF